MRVLFDQGVPVPLRRELSPQHEVETAYERGWSTLKNGELLETAEQEAYDVFLTTEVITANPALVIEGKLQKKDGSLAIKAERFWPLAELARWEPGKVPSESVPAAPSHDFR